MSPDNPPILIIGAGSIGERHIRNLLELGYSNIHAYRQRNLPLRTISPEKVRILTDWKDVQALQPNMAFVTSPTAFHLEQALACAQLGAHLFVEKPLTHLPDRSGISNLRNIVARKNLHLQVGYMMRHHPLLREVREAARDQRYGSLISFHSHWGEYLPDWHPWEDYRTSYAARKDLGGGVALTLSHDLDVALWIAGSRLKEYYIAKSHKNALEIDVEGSAEVLLTFEDETLGQVHLNFVQRNPERRYEYRFEHATMYIDFFRNLLSVQGGSETREPILEGFDRNDLFLEQTKAFMRAVQAPNQEYNEGQLLDSETILAICSGEPLPYL